MAVIGPDFLALQVRDLDRSAVFYESRLGLRRLPASPPGAVVFDTKPVPFAVREPLPGCSSMTPRPYMISLRPRVFQLRPRQPMGRLGGCSPSWTPTATPSPSTTEPEG